MKHHIYSPKGLLSLIALSTLSAIATAEETYKTLPYTDETETSINYIQISNKDLFEGENLKVESVGSVTIGSTSGNLSVGTLNIGTNDTNTAIVYTDDDDKVYTSMLIEESSTVNRQIQILTCTVNINGDYDGIENQADAMDYALIIENNNYLSVNAWGTLNINGNFLQLGTGSTLKIENNITVTGTSTIEGDIILLNSNGTGISNLGTLNLVSTAMSSLTFDTNSQSSLTVTNGTTLTTTDNEITILASSGSSYSMYGLNITDGDAFADKKIIIEAGDNTTTNVLYLRGDQSKVDSTKWVRGNYASMAEDTVMEIGSVEFNNNTMLMIDLETDVYVDSVYSSSYSQEITITSFLFGESFTGTSADTTTAVLSLANFDNDLFKLTSDYSIFTDEDGTNYLVINNSYIEIITDLDSELDYTLANVDGYLNYVVAVPEPSTYAMIFGSLALALAIYRRRK